MLCGGFILPVLKNSEWGLSRHQRSDVWLSLPFPLAFFCFRSQPGAGRAHKSGSRAGPLQRVVGARRRAPGCVSAPRGFTRGPHWLQDGHSCTACAPSSTRGIQDNERPDTASESFSTQTPRQQPPAQKMSPALKTTRHPWSLHLDSFPKSFLVV